MTDKWPRWVVDRYSVASSHGELGWSVVGDSLSNTKGGAKVEYLRTTGCGFRQPKDEENPQEGDCRVRQCRIEVKP